MWEGWQAGIWGAPSSCLKDKEEDFLFDWITLKRALITLPCAPPSAH